MVCFLYNFRKMEESLLSFANLERTAVQQVWNWLNYEWQPQRACGNENDND
jgi:hypothetical protein